MTIKHKKPVKLSFEDFTNRYIKTIFIKINCVTCSIFVDLMTSDLSHTVHVAACKLTPFKPGITPKSIKEFCESRKHYMNLTNILMLLKKNDYTLYMYSKRVDKDGVYSIREHYTQLYDHNEWSVWW